MFYRFTPDGRRKAIDLENLYRGSLFLCGGHSSLEKEDLSSFHKHGLSVMAMNNTATLVRPQIWVTADNPTCYSESLLLDPGILKFGRLVHQDVEFLGKKWREYSSTFFYGDSDKIYSSKNLLNHYRQLAWWKNVFILSLQIAYRLGFRKIYLCGVGFKIDYQNQYAYESSLSPEEVEYNSRCYSDVVGQIQRALPHFKESGLELISCTPDSALNSLIQFLSLATAIEKELIDYPEHNTTRVVHSSIFKKEES